MKREIIRYIVNNHLGDIASIIGLLLAIIGFTITVYQIRSAKNAAKQAEEEVRKLRETLRKTDTVTDLSIAISVMEEIKRLHRAEEWDKTVEYYADIRGKLITINTDNPNLSEEQRNELIGIITVFKNIESKIEKSINSPSPIKGVNAANLNKIVSEQMDKVRAILTSLKQRIGE
jgi:hypothetical protein